MPIPLIPVLIGVATTAVLWAMSEKDKKPAPTTGPTATTPGVPGATVPAGFPFPTAPAPAATPASSDDIFAVAPNGVLVVRQDKQHLVYAAIAQKMTAPLAADVTRPPVSVELVDPRAGFSNPALSWVQGETQTRGRHVLMHTSKAILASVPPGDELTWAAATRREWAVLANGQAAGSAPAPGTVNTPWGPISPPPGFPNIPGITPTSYDQNPQPTAPAPATPAPAQPAPTMPQPGQTVQTPWGPVTMPGAPGSPTAPAPGTAAPSAQQVQTRAGPWPANYTQQVRSGDLPSVWAQHYTGDFRRAEELRALNKLTQKGSGTSAYYTPWNGVMALPLGWNVAKGPPPIKKGAAKSSNPLGDLLGGVFSANDVAEAKRAVAAAGEDPSAVDEVVEHHNRRKRHSRKKRPKPPATGLSFKGLGTKGKD